MNPKQFLSLNLHSKFQSIPNLLLNSAIPDSWKLMIIGIFLLIGSIGFSTSLSAQCNADDFAALRALYMSTDGDNWHDTTGWSVVRYNVTPHVGCDLSSLHGITLTDGRVSEISLVNNNLIGHIPADIGNLSELITLHLESNRLVGQIPPEIGDLSNLEYLDLSASDLSGSIPPEIGNLTQLTILNLSQNKLTGSLPTEIGSLSSLNDLNLFSNKFSGSIPNEIGNTTNLVSLVLAGNGLTGSIPPEIGNLTQLTILNLSQNKLTGNLPGEIGNLHLLTSLIININQLSGCFDPKLKNLCGQVASTFIDSGNNFSGNWADFCATDAGICDCIAGDWKALNGIYNELGGVNWNNINTTNWQTIGSNTSPPLGFDLSTVPGIRLDSDGCVDSIRLRNKNLTGTLPAALSSMFHLRSLDLSKNNISGIIINELGEISTLLDLRLNQNSLTGSINTKGFENLRIYSLARNMLDMPIPEDIDHLSRLEVLAINNNPLGGEIPSTMGQLQYLKVLQADTTNISGCLPPNLKKLCPQLSDVSIDSDNSLNASWADFCASDLGICGPCDSDEEECDEQEVIWKGRISSDWHIPDNWLHYSIPDVEDNIFIPSDKTVDIFTDQIAAIESIVIDNESTLSIFYGASLNLVSTDADLRNDGTIYLEGLINSLASTDDETIRNNGDMYISTSGRLIIQSAETCLTNNGSIENDGLIQLSQCKTGIANENDLSNDGIILIDSTNIGIGNSFQNPETLKNQYKDQTKMMPTGEIGNEEDGSIIISNTTIGIINHAEFNNDGTIKINAAETAFINGNDMSGGGISSGGTQTKSNLMNAIFYNSTNLKIDSADIGILNHAYITNEGIIDMSHLGATGIQNHLHITNEGSINIDSSGSLQQNGSPAGFFNGIQNGSPAANADNTDVEFQNEGKIEISKFDGGGIFSQGDFYNRDSIILKSVYAGLINTSEFDNEGLILIDGADQTSISNFNNFYNGADGNIDIIQSQGKYFALDQYGTDATMTNRGEINIRHGGFGHMSVDGIFSNEDEGQVLLSGRSTNGFLLKSSGQWINELNSILDIEIEGINAFFEVETGGQMDGHYEITIAEEDR